MDTESIRKAYHENLVVLVVEDQALFCQEARHALPQHEVVFARTVEEAKEQYDRHLPNITFLDLDLPDGDGFSVLSYIRKQDPLAYVVVLSGSKLQDDVNAAQNKGAQGYIMKPFTRSRLEQCIQDYMKFREKNIKQSIAETEQRRFKTLKETSDSGFIN
ncbi:MAG: response regulator [Pseudomonadota bacterium]|nr:response regulator [Pseudomonadota bacterium]